MYAEARCAADKFVRNQKVITHYDNILKVAKTIPKRLAV